MARKRTRAESSSIKIYLTFSSFSSPSLTSRTGKRPGPGPGRDSSFIISPMLSPPRLAGRSGAVRGSYARQTTIAHRGKSRAPGDDFFFHSVCGNLYPCQSRNVTKWKTFPLSGQWLLLFRCVIAWSLWMAGAWEFDFVLCSSLHPFDCVLRIMNFGTWFRGSEVGISFRSFKNCCDFSR